MSEQVKRPYMRHPPCVVECRCDGTEAVYAAIGDPDAGIRHEAGGVIGFGATLSDALRDLADEIEKEVKVYETAPAQSEPDINDPEIVRRGNAVALARGWCEANKIDVEVSALYDLADLILESVSPQEAAPSSAEIAPNALKATPETLEMARELKTALFAEMFPSGTTPLLRKIVEICDVGSAQEFGDADERLRAIRGLIIGEAV